MHTLEKSTDPPACPQCIILKCVFWSVLSGLQLMGAFILKLVFSGTYLAVATLKETEWERFVLRLRGQQVTWSPGEGMFVYVFAVNTT